MNQGLPIKYQIKQLHVLSRKELDAKVRTLESQFKFVSENYSKIVDVRNICGEYLAERLESLYKSQFQEMNSLRDECVVMLRELKGLLAELKTTKSGK